MYDVCVRRIENLIPGPILSGFLANVWKFRGWIFGHVRHFFGICGIFGDLGGIVQGFLEDLWEISRETRENSNNNPQIRRKHVNISKHHGKQ